MKTLPKNTKLGRLKKRSEFLYVKNGRYRAQGGLVLQIRENPDHNGLRVGFTATKRIGNAVKRNRARRRLRAVVHQVFPHKARPGHDYVVIARHSTLERPYEKLVYDLEKALISLN